MRIALISDIHSNYPALTAVLEDISKEEVDEIFCAGDLVGYYAFPNEVIEELHTSRIHCIKGNHDQAVITETPTDFSIPAKRAADWTRRQLSDSGFEYLGQLKRNIRRKIADLDLYMTHGSPVDNLNQYVREGDVTQSRMRVWFDDIPDIVVLGHTHQPMIVELEDTLVVNPGSVGQPRDGNPKASYSIIDTEDPSAIIRRVDYDIDEVANETQKFLPKKLADRLYRGK